MMEIGIFRKELHEMDLRNNDMEEYVGAYNWVDVADGREVVFENSVEPIGFMTTVNKNGKPVELAILYFFYFFNRCAILPLCRRAAWFEVCKNIEGVVEWKREL